MADLGDRILSVRELNRAMLARQLLLERSSLSVEAAVEQVGGLQSQYAPAPYVGLWSRLQTFARDDLTTALVEKRVVQGTLMRSTIHVVSATEYPLFAAGVRPSRQAWWNRVRRRELDGVDMEAVARRVKTLLADGPRRQREIVRVLEEDGIPPVAWQGAGLWLDLVRVPPSGTWEQRRADLYGDAESWLGGDPAGRASAESSAREAPTEPDGLRHLLLSYLRGFGPATVADAASWAGVPVAALRAVVGDLELRRFRDEHKRELLDVPDGALPEPDTPAPARFLHVWEALLLVHARRTLVLPEEYRSRIFNTRNPQSFPTLLVDGTVAGTWRYTDGRVVVEPFEPLPAGVAAEVKHEATRLAAFHAG